jgi:UTP--glucose-1-phosphate uridylyltransferase
MKVVIPAAGLGTRFLPATKSMPKEMLPVGNRPVIQYVVEEAVAAGADDIIIVTGRGKRALEDHFDHNPDLGAWNSTPALKDLDRVSERAALHFVRQRAPLGLADAVLCASHHVGLESFGVLLGDSIYECDPPVLSQLRSATERWAAGGSAIALEVVPEDLVDHYGIVGGSSLDLKVLRVDRLVEKPSPADAPSQFAWTGAAWLSPRIFEYIRQTPPGKRGEVELTDAFQRLADHEPLLGVVIEGRRFDTGTPLLWFETNLRFGLRDAAYRQALDRVLQERAPPATSSETGSGEESRRLQVPARVGLTDRGRHSEVSRGTAPGPGGPTAGGPRVAPGDLQAPSSPPRAVLLRT